MKTFTIFFKFPLTLLILLSYEQASAEQIRVAVASNFTKAISGLVEQFEKTNDHTVTLIPGSTGKHYAQIINGAPYDIFFAADAVRPELLEQEGYGIDDIRFTYAMGKIILWSPEANYIDASASILTKKNFRFLAIANPRLAPYGVAAQEVLTAQGQWKQLKGKLVRGENIAQTFQFIKTGNAELGFVALSQIKSIGQSITGSFWEIPQSLYTPIKQQAILLRDNSTARSFIAFVQSDEGQAIIRSYGYDTP